MVYDDEQIFGSKPDALRDVEVIPVVTEGESHPVRSSDDRCLIDLLEASFLQVLRSSERLYALTQSLEAQNLRYCIFGGWVRDTVSAFLSMPVTAPPRDIDIVVCGIEVGDLLQRLPSDVRPTIFGGIQSNAEPIAFDIWPLHETFLIRYLHFAPTFESLLQSTDFTINAGLFFPRQGVEAPTLLDGGMLDALSTHILAFNGAFLPFPMIQCARLAAYSGKLALNLSPAVRAFMLDILTNPAQRELVLLGLDQNYPRSISEKGRQVIDRLIKEEL